ncbi:MAG: carboxylating nicotinate-nucleotide diphosphorylase [Ardenticatenaceae bacterium]|nr:carboxylating nicotinate-nucleotide diphosphorylase [Ardenticatenaceae bacterium]
MDKTITQIKQIIAFALAEDIGPGDATSNLTLAADLQYNGRFLVKAPGIIAGLDVAQQVFNQVDATLTFSPLVADGSRVESGTIAATVTGPARSLLTAERTALNFLQRMSGIATMTHHFVDAVAGTRAVILDTRKTAPGLRAIDKWAVRLGGGQNHRYGLYDMVLIKDNHIAAVGSITTAVERVRAATTSLPIEVEVKSLAELTEAVALNVDRIMLDNMSLAQMEEAVRMVNGRIPLEASGNVTLETVPAIAATGVDYISSGALTHSVKALDISLELNEQPANR